MKFSAGQHITRNGIIKQNRGLILTDRDKYVLKKALDLLVEKENDTNNYTLLYRKLRLVVTEKKPLKVYDVIFVDVFGKKNLIDSFTDLNKAKKFVEDEWIQEKNHKKQSPEYGVAQGNYKIIERK